MAQMIEHIALENGTLANPYRFIEKGRTVHLSKEEAEFYKGSWLRPTKEGRKILDTPPLFPGINMTGTNGVQAMKEIERNPRQGSDQYNDQMRVIIAAERKADGLDSIDDEQGEKAGTGNLDPLA